MKVKLSKVDIYAALFGRPRFKRLNEMLFLAGARGLGILNYKTPWLSGEERFLRRFLAEFDYANYLVLDVGANKGQFASWTLRNSSNLKVLSFEPNPASAEILKSTIGSSERHSLVEKGASSSLSSGKIYDFDQDSGSARASMYSEVITEIHRSETIAETQIELTTIDHELSRRPDLKVCLLKIDTEGHEKDVLLGAKVLLSSQPPEAVLLEFNEMNAVSKTHYRTIRELLEVNYTPYRLLPGGSLLPLKDASPLFTEIYAYQNLVFIRRHR